MLLTQRRADRVVLHNISWQKFENLLVDLGGSPVALGLTGKDSFAYPTNLEPLQIVFAKPDERHSYLL